MGKYTAKLIVLWYDNFGKNPFAEECYGCHSKNYQVFLAKVCPQVVQGYLLAFSV